MATRSLLSWLARRGTTLPEQRRSPPGQPADSGRRAKTAYLSALEIFRDLSAEDMEWLAATTTLATAQRGQVVYRPGEECEVLFLLKRGRVQIYRLTPEGKKVVTALLEPDTFFGQMALVGQQMQDEFAEVVEDATLCVLSRADLERLIQRRPAVALRFLEVLSRRLAEADRLLEEFAFKSVSARLASVLLRLAERHGSELVGFSHQDLADMAATYRETATQTLDRFEREGLVALGRRRVTILDSERLALVAGWSPR